MKILYFIAAFGIAISTVSAGWKSAVGKYNGRYGEFGWFDGVVWPATAFFTTNKTFRLGNRNIVHFRHGNVIYRLPYFYLVGTYKLSNRSLRFIAHGNNDLTTARGSINLKTRIFSISVRTAQATPTPIPSP